MSDITVSYKGNTIGTIDATGRHTVDTQGYYMEDDVTIDYVKPSSPQSVPSNDVNFIDYDGTILYAYSAAEFAQLTELPANPTHEGLTAQGWNWTLADAKAQVLISGQLNIGQTYITDDGKTRLYISITDRARMSPTLYWWQSVGLGVTIDWGDGSSTETVGGTANKSLQHTYSQLGDYVITMQVTNGTMQMGNGGTATTIIGDTTVNGGSSYRNCVKKIEIGSGVTTIRATSFYYLTSLESLTIPLSCQTIGQSALYGCPLRGLALPTGFTMASNTNYHFCACHSLRTISVPKSMTHFGLYSFRELYACERLVIPSGTTVLSQAILYNSFGLASIVIPSSVTSIEANAFYGCTGLIEIHFKSSTPPTVGNSNAFTNLPTGCKIYVPSGSLSTYTSATNYPSSATYTYIEE